MTLPLAKEPVFMLPVSIRDRLSELSGAELKVWVAYRSHANIEGIAWPGRPLLCEETGLSNDTISAARAGLKRKRWLVPVHEGRNSMSSAGKFGSPRFRPVIPSDLRRDDNFSSRSIQSQEKDVLPSRSPDVSPSRGDSVHRDAENPSLSSSSEALPKELVPREGETAAPCGASATAVASHFDPYRDDEGDEELPY
jgi:hypothetical protein